MVIFVMVGICSVVIGGAMFVNVPTRTTTTRESMPNTPGGSERADVMP
jgi:hypothetical protein